MHTNYNGITFTSRMHTQKTKQLNQWAWIISCIIMMLHFIPYLILWDEAYIRLHDTLEGEWIWLDILKKSGVAWKIDPQATIPQVMNGIPRNAFPTAYNFNYLFVEIFGTYTGYILNRTFIHLFGFYSMYVFLKNHIVIGEQRRYIVVLISLAFSLVPVFSVFGITVMGQPLLLHVFLNILTRRSTPLNWLYLCIFPLYSSLVWAAMPIILSLVIIGIHHYIKHKTISFKFILGIHILIGVYIISNLSMFLLMLQPGNFIPHRVAYNFYIDKPPQLFNSILDALMHFLINHYHVGTFLTLPILLAVLVSTRYRSMKFQAMVIIYFIIAISLFQGFYSFIEYYLGSQINFLRSFRLNRFSILLPALWLIAFAISLSQMYNSLVFRKLIMPFLIAQVLIILSANDEIIHNYRTILGVQRFPTFKQYMAEEQFDAIKKHIGKELASYRVVGLGFCPTITQYNGFYTLDSYQTIYDLNYKKAFRKIIEAELKKNDSIRYYFDGWGNRCYLYCSELGKDFSSFMISKYQNKKILNLEINTEALKSLGGNFVISSAEIVNPEKTGLKLEKVFEEKNSWWKLYLYSVI
ncbi:MAG: DUF6044 family protein [Flavobacteriales bacterium]|nr:DUF6044 family protein [Flavobacteriales bacterium]